MVFAVEVFNSIELRHPLQRAIQAVIPTVIGTMQNRGHPTRLRHYRRGMVPANVVKRTQSVVFTSRHHNRFSREIRREKIPFIPHLVRPADNLPRFAKHALLLQLLDLRVEIPWRRNRPRVVQRVARVVQIQKLANVSFHGSAPWPRHTNSNANALHPLILRNAFREKQKQLQVAGRICAVVAVVPPIRS